MVSRPPSWKSSDSIARPALLIVCSPTCFPFGRDSSFSAAFASRHVTLLTPSSAALPSRCRVVSRGTEDADAEEEEDEEEEDEDDEEGTVEEEANVAGAALSPASSSSMSRKSLHIHHEARESLHQSQFDW